MKSIENTIAELMSMLPMFIEALLADYELGIEIKLNHSESTTLMFIKKHSGDPMTEYSKKIAMSKASFTYVADKLEKKGLIQRIPVNDDRRKHALILTEKGELLTKKIITEHNQHIAKKIAHLSHDQLDNLKNALETLVRTTDFIKERTDIIE